MPSVKIMQIKHFRLVSAEENKPNKDKEPRQKKPPTI